MARPGTLAGPPPNPVREDVAQEFELEDGRILIPLTSRMAEISGLLDGGSEVDPEYIGRGIELWKRYGTELHVRRVQKILALFPATGRVSEAPGRAERRRLGKKGPASKALAARDTVRQEFQTLVRDQVLSGERISELHALLNLYVQQGYGVRVRLASLLKAFSLSEQAWARFQAEFARKSLDVELTPELTHRVRESLAESAAARVDLERTVREYLSAPIPVTSSAPTTVPAVEAQLREVEGLLQSAVPRRSADRR